VSRNHAPGPIDHPGLGPAGLIPLLREHCPVRPSWLVLTLLLVTIVLSGCDTAEGQVRAQDAGTPSKRTAPAVKATRVEVAALTSTSASFEIYSPGEIEGAHDARLAAALGGYVERVLVSAGQSVRKGQVLARIDTGTYQNVLDQIAVQREQAERDVARARSLEGVITGAQIEAAETKLRLLEVNARAAQLKLSRSTIRAPFAGVVAQIAIEQGEVAAPGAPLVRLVQLDPVKVSITVSDRDVVSLREGMAALILTGASGTTVRGTISHIDPVADIRTRAFNVEIEAPNSDGALLPGMIANIRIAPPGVQDQLVLPQDWLITSVDEVGVFVDQGSVARWRPVELGEVVRDQVVIAGGLAQGDRVIFVGHRGLADGDTLIVARAGTCCENGRPVF